MTACEPDRSMREARDAYFRANGLGDGGYEARWVKLRLGPVPFAFPNTASRRRAVPFHDLHHVVTGYATDVTGEAEIGAWEIASGCRSYPAAWLLNTGAVFLGFFVAPRATFRAFVRGRHSHNLYGGVLDDALLSRPVAELRVVLGLDEVLPEAGLGDRLAFGVSAVTTVAVSFSPTLALVWGLVAWLG